MRVVSLAMLALSLSGCVARTAVDIVTLPVKAVGAGVDAVTTSQSEADEKRGREMRKQEERDAKEARKRAKEERKHARQQQEDWERE